MQTQNVLVKACRSCGVEKPLTCFSFDRGKPRATCKSCRSTHVMERYHANKFGKTKKCTFCKKRLPIAMFVLRHERHSWNCRDCQPLAKQKNLQVQREWASNNRQRLREHSRKHRRNNVARALVYDAKSRAKRRGLPFDLTADDIVIPIRCPVLGIEIYSGEGRTHSGSPTIDRIRCDEGYVRGNVVVVSHKGEHD